MPADPALGDNIAERNDRPIDDAWIREHYPRIYRAAWLMTGDRWEAEDLAQETFAAAIDRWDRFEGRSTESTWLYSILIRLNQRRGRSLARMRRRLAHYIERHLAGRNRSLCNEDPQASLAHQQWRESIWAAVASLPSQQRDAVVLRFGEGMSYEQVALALACAVGTAKSRVHHGVKKLEAMLRNQGVTLAETDAPGQSPALSQTLNHESGQNQPTPNQHSELRAAVPVR